jgi:hypothetical protein
MKKNWECGLAIRSDPPKTPANGKREDHTTPPIVQPTMRARAGMGGVSTAQQSNNKKKRRKKSN